MHLRSNPIIHRYSLSKCMQSYKQYTLQEPINNILPTIIRIEIIRRTDIIKDATFILRLKNREYWNKSQFTGLKKIYRYNIYFGDLILSNAKSLVMVKFYTDEVIIIPLPGYYTNKHSNLKKIALKLEQILNPKN